MYEWHGTLSSFSVSSTEIIKSSLRKTNHIWMCVGGEREPGAACRRTLLEK